MPLFFLGTREWRNRQTRTVQVRVPVMEWGFNSPLAHDETADPSGSAVFVFPGCGCGAACGPMGVPSAAWGRAALCARGRRPAREIATREPAARSGRSRGPPWPCRRPPAPRPGPASASPINFARNSPATCSNIEFASLELQRFWGVSKNEHDKLRAKFERRWCRCCPWASLPGPVGQVGRLSETAIAFARWYLCGIETAITFAGAKWAFWVRFSVAEVMVVSMVAVQGSAVVLSVSKSPRCRSSCAKKFARRGLMCA